MNISKPIRAAILAGALLITVAPSQADDPFTLDLLLGDWNGVGWVIFPMVGAKMDVTGTLVVAHDSTGENYVTVLNAEKFMISYSATGLVEPDKDSDSLTWTVRDSFKRTAEYRGLVSEKGISGSMEYGKRVYTFSIAPMATDTMRVVIHRRHVEESTTEQIGELVLTPSIVAPK